MSNTVRVLNHLEANSTLCTALQTEVEGLLEPRLVRPPSHAAELQDVSQVDLTESGRRLGEEEEEEDEEEEE